MIAGSVLKTGPEAERAPDAVAQLWAVMGIPFTIEPRRNAVKRPGPCSAAIWMTHCLA
ncbi:MAG: hypothetical protein JOZ05_14865 [Acetobacteraceae bacterium]|nr:hypothetical protein [Acetobacteraceae bacterium]